MEKLFIRLDDACATMDWQKWERIFDALDKFNIKPLVAVIPNNFDRSMMIDPAKKEFWNIVKKWEEKGYYIGMHGFSHQYISKESGLVPMNDQSEFAGVDKELQEEKIKQGWRIFSHHSIKPHFWVAPSHTFDETTLKILKEYTTIRYISDGIAYLPFSSYGFVWLPQQLWWFPKKVERGLWTICLHPNSMSEAQIERFEKELEHFHSYCIKDELFEIIEPYEERERSLQERVYEQIFFAKRRVLKSNIFQQLYKRVKRA